MFYRAAASKQRRKCIVMIWCWWELFIPYARITSTGFGQSLGGLLLLFCLSPPGWTLVFVLRLSLFKGLKVCWCCTILRDCWWSKSDVQNEHNEWLSQRGLFVRCNTEIVAAHSFALALQLSRSNKYANVHIVVLLTAYVANNWVFYDMSGNIDEWVWDRYGNCPSEKQVDPKGPDSGSSWVAHGGSWGCDELSARNFDRRGDVPTSRVELLGVRLVRSSP